MVQDPRETEQASQLWLWVPHASGLGFERDTSGCWWGMPGGCVCGGQRLGARLGGGADAHPPDMLTHMGTPNPKVSSTAKAWALDPYSRRDPVGGALPTSGCGLGATVLERGREPTAGYVG